MNKCTCKNLAKRYKDNRECIKANTEALVVINFMIEKLNAFKPVILTRDVYSYSVPANTHWVTNFIDNVLCVVDSNIYKSIAVSSCKILNSTGVLAPANRLYTITIKYNSGACPIVIKLPLKFDELTVNIGPAYVSIINMSIKVLELQATALRSANLGVFVE